MPFAAWKNKYSVGNERIDTQHKSLFQTINELADASSENKENALYKCLGKMEKYAQEHFRDEEDFMKENGYPDLEKHIDEHKQFVNKVKDYQEAVFSNYIPFQDMLEFLNNWLVEHIITSDQKIMKYIKSK
ncbi:hemerythrin family protein [Maridesulfovibrio sp.]|uniref:bacteriohemerythrin n=1 Tax=Maridesulfovibrio sp. TaxID=2795000 RepID=UPI0029C9CC75|nr:hemerythrin family protein [Maridesulfovibrio sp.]